MDWLKGLTLPERSGGYMRRELRQDVLYGYFRFREVSMNLSRKTAAATRFSDALTERLLRDKLITPEQKTAYESRVLEEFSHADRFDDLPVEELYQHIHSLRKAVLGVDALERAQTLRARRGIGFDFAGGIDQRRKKDALLDACGSVTFVLLEAELFSQMAADLEKARHLGKQIRLLCGEPGDELPSRQLLEQWLGQTDDLQFVSRVPESNTLLLIYGEEGLLACRGLEVDAVVTAVPTGYFAQAVTNQLGDPAACVVYIPRGFDITPHVRLTQKTRLTFQHLALLQASYGDGVYSCSPEELYRRYPGCFINIYDGGETALPVTVQARNLSDFDRQLDVRLGDFLNAIPNVTFQAAYFDESLTRQPICYDSTQPQPGILVQTVRVKKAAGARVLPCEKGVTPRQMFRDLALPGTGLVSNFLFFMTPKLGLLYNDLRADRPREQADAASGHLDYMLAYRDGKRIETFPLFGKTCIAMRDDGQFFFWNYFLGGGSVDISGVTYHWEAPDVNSEHQIRIYTPYASSADKDADRNTYRKTVGEGRVNVVMLRQSVTCIRRGDVVLPSVGVVLSLTEEAAKPLLERLRPLEDGYFDVTGLELTVKLDPPPEFDPQDWERLQWAYGGGLTLIRNGEGLCDGDHMESWFETEGWTSPLSRQTQESNLHTLVKHPRTAIGCTKEGELVILVYSGRTWRSCGADYREMITIARQLYPDIQYLMNADGGGSAMLGLVHGGEFMELSFPSTSSGSCAGQVRPINTVFYVPAGK